MNIPSDHQNKKSDARDRVLDKDAWNLHETLSDLVRAYQLRDRKRICYYDLSVTQCHAIDALIRCGSLALKLEVTELDRTLLGRIDQDPVNSIKELLSDVDGDVRQAATRHISRLARAAADRFSCKGK